ncbi:hypothetical protein [Glaciecola sp. 1036]|uniref:hypothetical protein n=1 Tax=Alteromonadaceae TaxID=72275 RepID=UPI003CFE9996
MESVSEQIGTEFNAVVGWGYFSHYFTEIDYQNGVFNLYKTSPESTETLSGVRFNTDAGPLIFSATLNNKEVNLMLDTGSPVSVFDPSKADISAVDDVQFTVNNQVVKVAKYEQDLSVLADLGVVGIVGGDFLAQYKVLIDPKNKRLYLL